jgi:prevent-host-death family protein
MARIAIMKTATITEAKNGLSALIDQVRAGQTVLILDRGVPVARLEPIARDPDQTGRLERLERAGIVRVPTTPPPVDLIRRPGPPLAAGASLLDALLDERRSGR